MLPEYPIPLDLSTRNQDNQIGKFINYKKKLITFEASYLSSGPVATLPCPPVQ